MQPICLRDNAQALTLYNATHMQCIMQPICLRAQAFMQPICLRAQANCNALCNPYASLVYSLSSWN